MADFCRFFRAVGAAGEPGDHAVVERLRTSLAHERESFRVCLQTLSHLLGLRLNEIIRFDRSFVMKDDVVSIYLSGELPESVVALLSGLDAQPARKHAVALQIGRLLKARLHHGLYDVVQALDGVLAKDLYSRSIACLLRLCMCALKAECDIRRGASTAEGDVLGCLVDETGTSLCEMLSRCCLILCVFSAEESDLFDDVRVVQETLLRLVPGPLILHIVGAFPVVAFDGSCLFSLQNRRVFVETLAANLPDLLDQILIFNRIEAQPDARVRDPRRPRLDAPDGGGPKIEPPLLGEQRDAPQVMRVSAADVLQSAFDGITWSNRAEGYNTRNYAGSHNLVRTHSSIHIDTDDWEFAFGNVPRVRTLSLLLEFILRFVKVSVDGVVEKHMLGWLDALVSNPSFGQIFAPIFSTGDTTNFRNILALSRMLGRDLFISHLILSIGQPSDEALRMASAAGLKILMSDPSHRRAVLDFLIEGVAQRPQEVIHCWFELLYPVVLPRAAGGGRSGSTWPSGSSAAELLTEVSQRLIDAVVPHALMQNFGDDCHPDEDNVHACAARQLLVLLVELVGTGSARLKLESAVEAGVSATEVPATVETVQLMEFAVFCLWLLKVRMLTERTQALLAFVHRVNERTLHETAAIYYSATSRDSILVRLDAMDRIRRNIRARRLKDKVAKCADFFDDPQLLHADDRDWMLYYRECGNEIIQQLTDSVLHRLPRLASGAGLKTPTVHLITQALNRHSRRRRGAGSRSPKGTAARPAEPVKANSLTAYLRRASLLLHVHRLNGTQEVNPAVYITISAVLASCDVQDDECVDVLGAMLDQCPLWLLYRMSGSKAQHITVCLMEALARVSDSRLAEVLPQLMEEALAAGAPSNRNSGPLAALVQLVASVFTRTALLAEMFGNEHGVSTLQNFVVFVNCLRLSAPAFLEARGVMNLALIERYLQREPAGPRVIVTAFVQAQLRRVLAARSGRFSLLMQAGRGPLPRPKPVTAARGQLNTLDAIVVSTFQLFFDAHPPSDFAADYREESHPNDVFHWSLLGPEYAVAFRTATLLFRCFDQLSDTKLMFIVEHFVGVAAGINGHTHANARKSILTDDNLLRPDAVEYFYQVYRNVAKRCSTSRGARNHRARAY
ncbi:peptidylprolyl isomerase [Babesia caballi]|uniref:Peptidylprolyl isomerase n=1 Tax=Babesia caballi TaxID=5871 RepID=A0AAV4LZT2_BABCB|nr:peptidylprolyl isomerase [Babesia caballi]